MQIRDNPGGSRYEIWDDGELAGSAGYRLHDRQITFIHTEIDMAREGAGLGSQLTCAALTLAPAG